MAVTLHTTDTGEWAGTFTVAATALLRDLLTDDAPTALTLTDWTGTSHTGTLTNVDGNGNAVLDRDRRFPLEALLSITFG